MDVGSWFSNSIHGSRELPNPTGAADERRSWLDGQPFTPSASCRAPATVPRINRRERHTKCQ